MKIFLPSKAGFHDPCLLRTIGKIMKYTALVVFFHCSLAMMLYAEKGNGQSLNEISVKIVVENQTLDKVFEQIEAQSRLKLVYSPEIIRSAGAVTVSRNKISIEEALRNLLPNSLRFEQIGTNVLISEKPKPIVIKPVDWPVTGKVVDEKGEPLPGVTVKIEGTAKGTVTDIEGNFKINVSNDKVQLSFSFIGYETKVVPVGNSRTLQVQLQPGKSNSLEEVVVVGYGTQKKSDITGSISVITEKALREIPAGNIGTALQGMAPGLGIQKAGGNSHPGSTPVIRIRGERSLGAGSDPLIILDGIPYDGSLNDISQDDIVSAQVLKDASSTAIYGSRGANGVILINTRKGKANQKAIFSYNGYAGFNKILGQFDLMDAEQFAEFKKWARWNATTDAAKASLYENNFDHPKLLEDAFGDKTELDAYKAGGNTNWQDLIFKNGMLTNHQVGMTGGTENTQYAASLGYYKAEGIYENQDMTRYSLKFTLDQKIGKYVKVGINSLNSYNLLTGMNLNPMDQASQASPFITPYLEDGTLRGILPGAGGNVWNPLSDFVDGALVDDKKRVSTFTNGYVDVDFTHGFKYKLNAGIQLNPENEGRFYASETTKQLGGRNYGRNYNSSGYNYTIENILTYNKTIADRHNINFTGLFSVQESQRESNTVTYYDVMSDFIQYYNPKYASDISSEGDYTKWNLMSYMGRLNYNFKEKYLMTLTLRSDGSSRLAPGNKWHTFPSAALGWNIAKESFLESSKAISALKLRASYGTVGNTAINPYATLGGLSDIRYNFGSANVLGTYPTKAVDYNLSWENTTSLNFGLDYGFLNNRVSGSIEYYKQYTDDILLEQSLPKTSGIRDKIRTNVGKTENSGVEFNITSVNFQGTDRKDFSWSTDLNIFLNRNKITELASGAQQDIGNNWFVGHPKNLFYGLQRVGIWQDTPEDIALAKQLGLQVEGVSSVIGTVKIADTNGDNKINDDDRVFLGDRQPDFEGGLTNRFSYKDFDFSVVTYFKVGSLMKSGLHGGWMNTFEGKYNNLDVHYWTPENNENYWPKPNAGLQNPNYKSTLDLVDGSYLKIRNITLGYTIPASKLNIVGVKSARIYATASNPFVFFSEYKSKFGGLDPETNFNLDINTPALWSMLFGINVSF